MSIFDFPPPFEEKPVALHPWAKSIKYKYAQRFKHAHNSIYNPKYPKLPIKEEEDKLKKGLAQETQPEEEPVRFKVIGVRVSEDFIYCSRLLEGLYKYRCKKFAQPVLRAVTTVEWPKVLNDIRLQYRGIAYCIKSPCLILMNDELLGGIDELKELILAKYSYHLCLDYYKESIKEFTKFVNSTNRSFVYMHFQINGVHIGTMIFMLYTDIVPNTCENFMRLCTKSRGGYKGTPVHRIVKDCWIQCGGFGLKDSGMTCENFVVPFDRRGVLGMANAERHVDCSTQFFIILQPAPWMKCKYVAFGQLVDGNSTLQEIENCSAYYEAPTKEIKIYASGILNLECHDIMVNKHTTEYINAHIENICEVGEMYSQELWEKLTKKLDELEGVTEDGESSAAQTQENKRFSQKGKRRKHRNTASSVSGHDRNIIDIEENNDFDVESYLPEEYSYRHVTSTVTSDDLTEREEKLFYMPLTDVPYPGETESTFDLVKFLKGDYCLECDLQLDAPRKVIRQFPIEVLEEMMDMGDEVDMGSDSDMELDSEDEKEINSFFKERAERVCFAGNNVKRIAKASANMFRGIQRLGLMSAKDVTKLKLSTVITDEELRMNRVKLSDRSGINKDRHISLTVPTDHIDKKVKRRQTGFVKNMDLDNFLDKIAADEEEEEEERRDEDEPYITRKIRTKTAAEKATKKAADSQAQSAYRHGSHDDDEEHRKQLSTLKRLYEDVRLEEGEPPTLKDYRPLLEAHSKHLLLTISRNVHDDEDVNLLQYHQSEDSLEHILVPHPMPKKRVETKISSDYFNTLEHHHQQTSKGENSIRSAEFAKTRPTLSVTEYQLKNKKSAEVEAEIPISPIHTSTHIQHLDMQPSTRVLGELLDTTEISSKSERIGRKNPVSFEALRNHPAYDDSDADFF